MRQDQNISDDDSFAEQEVARIPIEGVEELDGNQNEDLARRSAQRIETLISESLHGQQEIEELVDKLFIGLYGEGASIEDPELYAEFKGEFEQILARVGDEDRRFVIAKYLEQFIENETTVDEPSKISNSSSKPHSVNSGSVLEALREALNGIQQLGVFAVVGSLAVTGGFASSVSKEPVAFIAPKNDDESRVEIAESTVKPVVPETEIIDLVDLVDEKLEALHKQYRTVILESLAALAEEKARAEKNKLQGLFESDVSEAAKKAKRIADAEIVIQEAIVVLSAFRGSDTYGKLEKIAERLKQVHNLNHAFRPPVRLFDVVEEANVSGFVVVS